MHIGERIRHRREQLEMSQDELARKLGYKSRSSITKIEKEASGLPQPKISEIAKALQTSPSYIMGWFSEDTQEIDIEALMPKIKKWGNEFGQEAFSDEEYQKIVEYARFLISQRKK